MYFHKYIWKLTGGKEAGKTTLFIRGYARAAKRDGTVIGLSSRGNSGLTAALYVRAFSREKGHELILTKWDSSAASAEYGLEQARALGITTEIIDITPGLEALGTYE